MRLPILKIRGRTLLIIAAAVLSMVGGSVAHPDSNHEQTVSMAGDPCIEPLSDGCHSVSRSRAGPQLSIEILNPRRPLTQFFDARARRPTNSNDTEVLVSGDKAHGFPMKLLRFG